MTTNQKEAVNFYIPEDSRSSTSINLVPIFVGLALISGIGLSFGVHSLVVGHHHTFGTTREVPWGLLIAPYVFFACLSTGLCIVSSLGQVFRIKIFEPIVPRTVFLAIATMATGLMCITLELEVPWRVGVTALTSPHPTSNIWWKTTIYSLYMIFMLFNFLSLIVKNEKLARIFAIIALVTVTMGNLNMNSDMGILGARGFWSENYMPLYFLSLSTLTGCAAILLFSWIGRILTTTKTDHELEDKALQSTAKLFLFLLFGILYFTGVKIMGGFSPEFTKNPEAMHLLVKGGFALNFWVGEVALAVIFPLILIFISGKKTSIQALAGICCLVGSFILFYNLVIVGQLIPHYYEYNVVGLPKYYPYSPSLHEIMITAGSIFFFLTAFIFGEIIQRKRF